MNQLHLAGVADLPDPPYPADTHVGAWIQNNDPARVEQSVTWQMAPDHVQPTLLMAWHKAWLQWPSGSLPGDVDELCAVLRLDRKVFDQYRTVIMRGWYLASDKRYYHPILVDQVLHVIRRRVGWARSKSTSRDRARQQDDAPRGGQARKGEMPPGFVFASPDERKW